MNDREKWRERSGISVLAARHDDDDDDNIFYHILYYIIYYVIILLFIIIMTTQHDRLRPVNDAVEYANYISAAG